MYHGCIYQGVCGLFSDGSEGVESEGEMPANDVELDGNGVVGNTPANDSMSLKAELLKVSVYFIMHPPSSHLSLSQSIHSSV